MPRRHRKPGKRQVRSSHSRLLITIVIIILVVLVVCVYALVLDRKKSLNSDTKIKKSDESLLPAIDEASLQCRDERDRPVDWYIVYKLPVQEGKHRLLSSGFAYAFVTSSDDVKEWRLSKNLVTDKSCIFARTLTPIASESASVLMYNDDPPDDFGTGKSSSSRAHAKGVLALSQGSGFWLIHSIPNFPMPASKTYSYPSTGRLFGQTALCISLNSKDEGSDIINHLKHIGPNIYYSWTTKEVTRIVPVLKELLTEDDDSEDESVGEVTTVGSVNFLTFARSGRAAKSGDLYSHMLAPSLDSSLLVETWRRGRGTKLNSDCRNELHVSNVRQMKIRFTEGSEVPDSGVWTYVRDHSKWAISESEDKGYVCIGDINRMESQQKRGGGTVCMRNSSIWRLFRHAVHEIEACST